MENRNLARKAGLFGMVGAALWLIAVYMQNGLGITSPTNGALWIGHELLCFAGLLGAAVALLGLRWGGDLRGRVGALAVGASALGYALLALDGG